MRRLLVIALALALAPGCYDLDVPLWTEPPAEIQDVPIEAITTCADPIIADVACVLDGDTFDIGTCGTEFGERVRMLGINAPEIAHEDAPEECYGYAASDALKALISSEDVLLTFDKECTGVYGRTLAYVWLPLSGGQLAAADGDILELDGETYVMLNTWMVREGYAVLFEEERFGTLIRQEQFNDAQTDAQASNAGLWGACDD